MTTLNTAQFQAELQELLKRHQAAVGVNVDGDTHGLHYDFVVMDESEKETVIAGGLNYVDSTDIKVKQAPYTFNEVYRTACVSTAHLSEQDRDAIKVMLKEDLSMIAERPTGYFFKLFGDEPVSNHHDLLSIELNALLVEAARQGFQCIEFDRDADEVSGMPTYDW